MNRFLLRAALMLAAIVIGVRSAFQAHKTPENCPFRMIDPLNEEAEIQEEHADPLNFRLAWRGFRRRVIIRHYWQMHRKYDVTLAQINAVQARLDAIIKRQ